MNFQAPLSILVRALCWLGFRSGRSRHSERTRPLLSKTKYLVGLQCSKALWIHYNDKGLLPNIDGRLSAIFDQGHRVGDWSKKLFPTGKDLGRIGGFDKPVEATRKALRKRKPIFEASFIYNSCFSRADILTPAEGGRWDIIEVKSSGAPDDPADLRKVYLQDMAFQRYVYEGAGLSVRNCFLLLMNKRYIRSGRIDTQALFSRIDVTARVDAMLPAVHSKVEEMKSVMALPACPEVKVSRHCSEPYECSLMESCWSFLPQPSVFDLRNGRDKPWDLLAQGILRMEDVPHDALLSEAQTRQIAAHRSGLPHIDGDAIEKFLARLQYPLFFLDFETIQSAVPMFDRSRPFTAIPFQFSLHIIPEKGAPVQQHGFLADGKDDPRPAFISELRSLLGSAGSIVGYNTAFEAGRLADCARFFPECAEWVAAVSGRFIDLLDVFRGMWYYHPSQRGSASLKAVLPALTSASYEGLQIPDGDVASREFMRITFSCVGRRERKRVRRALEEYCAQDTRALIDIMQALERCCVTKIAPAKIESPERARIRMVS